jgi:hypothetical protein
VREQVPEAKMLTVLQNIDALYWRAAGERAGRRGVRVKGSGRARGAASTRATACSSISGPL